MKALIYSFAFIGVLATCICCKSENTNTMEYSISGGWMYSADSTYGEIWFDDSQLYEINSFTWQIDSSRYEISGDTIFTWTIGQDPDYRRNAFRLIKTEKDRIRFVFLNGKPDLMLKQIDESFDTLALMKSFIYRYNQVRQ